MDFLYKGVRGCAMTSPFDMAWALLKSDPTQVDLSTEEGRVRHNAYVEAYSKVRPPNMTDEMYDDHIERTVESILNGVPSNKPLLHDYPWPKRKVFQSTFDLDGSINRDPMLSRQRKLNARMARESNRREAVPSRIEISPRDNNRGGRDFSLLNNEGEVLSQISGYGNDKHNPTINDFYGGTIEPYRRQGMYRKLMQALIGAGIPVKSDERNYQSNPFHQKFLESLPPNIESSYVDAYGNPKTENSVEDLSFNQPLYYHQNRVPQFDNARGRSSGLHTKDYGAIPIINQENQARNVDELAEQDRLKIKRGQGYIPEMLPLHVTQPMARNTTQSNLNLDLDFPTYNNLRPRPLPRPHQRYTTQQQDSYPPDDFYAQVQRLSQEGLENMGNQQ
jgi:hypothetical protein